MEWSRNTSLYIIQCLETNNPMNIVTPAHDITNHTVNDRLYVTDKANIVLYANKESFELFGAVI